MMSHDEISRLQSIHTFPSLIKYLRDDLGWPIDPADADELTFEYEPKELGLDDEAAVKIKDIKQLRPLTTNQPWGIFFVNFEPKRLPVVVLRRILSALVLKKRAMASKAHQAVWACHDLLFISSYGITDERSITFAHFTEEPQYGDLPALRVLAWDDQDTALHLAHAHDTLKNKLKWPDDEADLKDWREQWSSAFTLRHRQVVTTSKELAIRLAELARSIRKRANLVLAVESKHGPFKKLHAAFKEALVHDLSEDGFADMYAQTVTYGLLTARVSRPAGLVADDLAEMVPVTNPFLKELLGTFLNIGGRKKKIDFDELGINDVVELLRQANMEAVLRDFGNRNPNEDPVIHFYELFLKEYDAKEKVKRGVFYTPLPVVSFIVRSVDEVLKTEFGLEDGLADTTTWGELQKRKPEIQLPKHAKPETPFVQILDFATGTGTFMVQVIDIIYKTMTEKWKKASYRELEVAKLWDEYVPRHLLPRLYGFELMMAPYAIAHMKIGLKLWETGYRFRTEERVRLYLTNTLEEPKDFSEQIEMFAPALAHEAKAAGIIKSGVPISVVIGNPPYSGHSANVSTDTNGNLTYIGELLRKYYDINGQPLNERNPKWLQDDYVKFIRFAEVLLQNSGYGVLGAITNHSYLDNPTFRAMRYSLCTSYTETCLIDLHGNLKKAEVCPDGSNDENIFDIMQGVCINISYLIAGTHSHNCKHHELFGLREIKYRWLLEKRFIDVKYQQIRPTAPMYLFQPVNESIETEYSLFISFRDISPKFLLGFQTHRDEIALAFSKNTLYEQVSDYLGHKPLKHDWDSFCKICDYRPFDRRFAFLHKSVTDRPRTEITEHLFHKNIALNLCRQTKINIWRHAFVSRYPTPAVFLEIKDGSSLFPFMLFCDNHPIGPLFEQINVKEQTSVPNLSNWITELFSSIAQRQGFLTTLSSIDIFSYAYAILFSNEYSKRYLTVLKRDFPCIPVPASFSLLKNLIFKGTDLIALHLLEHDYPKISSHVANILSSKHSNLKDPKFFHSGYQDISAGYPKYDPDNTTVLINPNNSGFQNVPEDVYNFHIGGYQVCEKWLKDRRSRTLKDEDIEHYQKIVVAIKETIRLMEEIDKVIEEHGGFPDAFVTDPKIIEEAKTKAKASSPF